MFTYHCLLQFFVCLRFVCGRLLTGSVFFDCRIDHFLHTVPFFGRFVLDRFAAVLGQKACQLITTDPDLAVAVFLGFIEDKLQTEVQMYNVDIIYIFFIAVSGMAHITDDITGSDKASFF